MTVKERVESHIQELSGNKNAGLWTLEMPPAEELIRCKKINSRNTSGNILLQSGDIQAIELNDKYLHSNLSVFEKLLKIFK